MGRRDPYCRDHRHPKLRRAISREQVRDELSDLYHRAGFQGPVDLDWTGGLSRTHDANWRRYAQVAPHAPVDPHFELAPQAVRLPPKNRRGLLAHEVGHALSPEGTEDDADRAAYEALGIKIRYDHRWPGKGLQLAYGNPGDCPRCHRLRPYLCREHAPQAQWQVAPHDAPGLRHGRDPRAMSRAPCGACGHDYPCLCVRQASRWRRTEGHTRENPREHAPPAWPLPGPLPPPLGQCRTGGCRNSTYDASGLCWACQQPTRNPRRNPSRIERTLAALDKLREELGLLDIGVSQRRKTIWLLASARTLNRSLHAWPIRQFLYKERGGQTYMVWDEQELAIKGILNEARVPTPSPSRTDYGPWDDWTVIPIPTPGGPQYTWWSARKGVKQKPVKVSPYRFCAEEPHRLFGPGQSNRPVLLELQNSNLPPVFVSHGVGYHDFAAIRRCGGLLWPSLAVTWKVPPSYGDIVFLYDVHLLINTLSPTGRAQKRLLIAPTDIWSPTARELERTEKAITHELRGTQAWWAGAEHKVSRDEGYWGNRGIQDKLLLGATDKSDLVGSFAPTDEVGDRVRSMNQLWSRIKKLVKLHAQIDPDVYGYEDVDALKERLSRADAYSYLEVKVQGTVPVDAATACFFPRRKARTVNRFLDDMGFTGWRVPFDYTGQPSRDAGGELWDHERARWARAATDAILAWSREPCAGKVVVPESMLSSAPQAERYPYRPVAPYSKAKDYGLSHEYGLHFGWTRGYCPRPQAVPNPRRRRRRRR
jgi:hypothetical protein